MLFLAGVLCSSLLLNDAINALDMLLLLTVAIFLLWFLKLKQRMVIIFLFVFLIGFVRFFFSIPDLNTKELAYYNNDKQEIQLRGCIVDEVDRRRDHSKLTFEVNSVTLQDKFLPVFGRVLVTVSKYSGFNYGDCLELYGILQAPGEFNGFSYDNYLARYGIYSVMYRPSVKRLDFTEANPIYAFLFNLKTSFEQSLNKLFHEPHSSFAAGLITGSRRGIPPGLMESFNITGLTHIIAISGYNITLLIVVIAAIFGFLPRFWRVILSILIIIAFTIFVGASAAVVRAAIMGVIGLLALQFGRRAFVLLVLFVSAALMNLYNPYTLVYDVGFQLSFAATLGLIIFGKKFEKYFTWLPNVMAVRESFVMTLAAQVFTLPLIIFHFARVSVVSPIANVLVGPLIPLAMLFSFLAAVFSFVWSGLAKVLAFLAWFFLEAIVKIAQLLAQLPGASVEF